MVIDIDEFQSVNNSYGLSIGHSALLAVARRLARDLRPGDTWRGSEATPSQARWSTSPSRSRWTRWPGSTRCAPHADSFSRREMRSRLESAHPKLHGGQASAQQALANAKPAAIAWKFFAPIIRLRTIRPAVQGQRHAARSNAARSHSLSGQSCGSRIEPWPGSSRSCASSTIQELGVLGEDEFSSAAKVDRRNQSTWGSALEATARELAAHGKTARGQSAAPHVAASSRPTIYSDVRAALGRPYVQRGSLKLAAARAW